LLEKISKKIRLFLKKKGLTLNRNSIISFIDFYNALLDSVLQLLKILGSVFQLPEVLDSSSNLI
jgi:hypothetical protein